MAGKLKVPHYAETTTTPQTRDSLRLPDPEALLADDLAVRLAPQAQRDHDEQEEIRVRRTVSD